MAFTRLTLIFACVALVAAENAVEIRKIASENNASVAKVNENVSENGAGSTLSGSVFSDLLPVLKIERSAKRVYIPVATGQGGSVNHSHPPVSRVRQVQDAMDLRPKKTFLEATNELQDFSVQNVARPKSWLWDQLEQAYGFMNDIVSDPSDLDEGRAKKKKKKILFFLIKLVIGLKVLLMGVLLPGVLTFTTVLSWKAVTLSILAFAFAKLGALKSMLKGFVDSGEKTPSHHFVISPPSHWEKRSHPSPKHHEHPPTEWLVDPSHHSNPYRRSYPHKP